MYKLNANALLTVLMMLISTGCATTTREPSIVVREKIVRVMPPHNLAAECVHPADPIDPSFSDLVLWLHEYRNALELRNVDKKKLNQWMDE